MYLLRLMLKGGYFAPMQHWLSSTTVSWIFNTDGNTCSGSTQFIYIYIYIYIYMGWICCGCASISAIWWSVSCPHITANWLISKSTRLSIRHSRPSLRFPTKSANWIIYSIFARGKNCLLLLSIIHHPRLDISICQ